MRFNTHEAFRRFRFRGCCASVEAIAPVRVVKKRALLIAIRYAETRERRLPVVETAIDKGAGLSVLENSHRDLDNFKDFLLNHYGYLEADITVMKDDPDVDPELQPTQENIRHQMKHFAASAEEGDHLFFYYSGHGAQSPEALTGTEEEDDYMNEAIIPCDAPGRASDEWDYWIIDNEMRRILVDSLPDSCTMIAITDSCSSGTILDLDHQCNRVWVPWPSNHMYRRVKQAPLKIPPNVLRFCEGASGPERRVTINEPQCEGPIRHFTFPLNNKKKNRLKRAKPSELAPELARFDTRHSKAETIQSIKFHMRLKRHATAEAVTAVCRTVKEELKPTRVYRNVRKGMDKACRAVVAATRLRMGHSVCPDSLPPSGRTSPARRKSRAQVISISACNDNQTTYDHQTLTQIMIQILSRPLPLGRTQPSSLTGTIETNLRPSYRSFMTDLSHELYDGALCRKKHVDEMTKVDPHKVFPDNFAEPPQPLLGSQHKLNMEHQLIL